MINNISKDLAKGFTLIEMMIVIAIAAILLATAAPSFQTMVIKSYVESLQDNFANAVITARTEAASRGVEVRVCPMGGCATNSWRDGWMLEVDEIDPSTPETTEIIATFENDAGYPVTVHSEGGASETSIAFDARGYNAREQRYIFAVCGPSETNPKVKKGVTVEFSGRAYHTQGTGSIHQVKFDNNTTTADLQCMQA